MLKEFKVIFLKKSFWGKMPRMTIASLACWGLTHPIVMNPIAITQLQLNNISYLSWVLYQQYIWLVWLIPLFIILYMISPIIIICVKKNFK